MTFEAYQGGGKGAGRGVQYKKEQKDSRNEVKKHQDPWSKGSQAGSNVPETTQSKLLEHLRKAYDARGLQKRGGRRRRAKHTV